jgi:hypothetical protein
MIMLFAAGLSQALAGTNGKIAGTVKDKKTGEPLIGCNVVLEGTTMGAATDLDGRYTILNIPPGTYVINVTLVGYEMLFVREGYRSLAKKGAEDGLALDAGVRYQFEGIATLEVDYAYNKFGVFGNLNTIAIAVGF